MSIISINKVAAAVAATLLLASTSSFAADELVEYFPDGDLEGLTGFEASGWGMGNLVYEAPTGIFLFRTAVDADGNKIPVSAYGQIGTGWSRYIDNTRTQAAGPQSLPERSEHAPAGNDTNVQFQNHMRSAHSDGLAREVEGIQVGVTYYVKGDGATKGTLQWAYAYSKQGAPVDDNGNSEVTLVALTNTVLSDNAWVTLEDSFTAPADTDITQPFKVYLRTADLAPAVIVKTEYARMWVDNFSLKGPEIPDADEDGISDLYDKFPNNAAAATDTDDDAMPDDFLDSCDQACIDGSGLTLDNDDDNDTVLDINDAYPLDATKTIEIEIGPDFSMFIENTTITLDASESVPNSDVGTYSWLQLSGTEVTLAPDGQTVSFTAPDVEAIEEAEFELTIEDAINTEVATYPLTIVPTPATVTASATIMGMDEANGSTIVIETNEDGIEIEVEYINVAVGDVIVISGSATTDSENIEDNEFTYLWKQFNSSMGDPRWDQRFVAGGGISESEFTFTVPEWNEDTPIVFQLTVDNGVNWPDTEKRFDASVDTATIKVNLVKTQSPVPDGGSLGFIGMMLLGGLSLVRRLVKSKK
ncbi:hypothetical protein [Colwellia sp. 12G3]|uniref:hypothetical protein n=1 Tax=Colwellia sp. 12G3 TaxID=2058299 RepID=UPI000C34D1EC|nr:hypothetical protein [Colwellia sp. 12G3]PKI16662.1 hypothetical protein CXF71_08690 [Colwellia sp. 12G3]